jgi:DNA-binding SARP family transcriptional activator/tetratricopeptide (TPR) repeat protein
MIYLRTLGELRLEGSDAPALTSPRKELTLLAFLARRTPRPVSRSELATLLWDSREEAKARKSLRQALFELKRALGDGLVLGSEQVHLAPGALGWDVDDFEEDLSSGNLERAVERWKGDFLPGSEVLGGERFRAWLESEREHLRQRLRGAFESLTEGARQRGAWREGLAQAERWVNALPFDVPGHRQRIEFLHLDGRTDEALAHHAAFRSSFRAEFDLEPPAEFLELVKRLERPGPVAGARLATSAALFTPDLVGRGAALAELISVWHAVQVVASGVMVEGEAGIGKSRLCEEFLRWLREEGQAVIVETRSYESNQGIELGIVRSLIGGLSDAPGLPGAPPRALAELARLSPNVADRFPHVGTPPEHQYGLEEAVIEALRAVAQEQAVVVFIDDFHWADQASQRLVASIPGRLRSGVLLLVSVRTGDAETTPEVVALGSLAAMRRLKLQPLSLAGVESLLESMVPLEPLQRHDLARRLHAQGGGNPFFTIELTAGLVDDGFLTPTESGRWLLTEVDKLISLPGSIRAAVGRRLTRLSAQARTAAEGAAVLGRVFDPALVTTVTESSFPDTAIGIEELIARKLVRDSSTSPGMYEFTHEITWRVTYELLPANRRAALHLAAAKEWESRIRRSPAAAGAAEYHRSRVGNISRRERWRSRWMVIPALMALLVLGTVLLLSRSRTRPDSITSNRLAILPFSVQGPQQYAYLREGLPTLLSVALEGADSLSPVDPRSVQRAVNREGAAVVDPLLAGSLAERMGAQLYVLGEVVGAGTKIRISATAYDRAGDAAPVARAVAEGGGDDVLGLADALARQLLAARKPAPSARLTRTAALTTSSLEAFKFYIEGERALRDRRKGEALEAFHHAIELDSTFALAHYQLAVAERISGSPDSALARARRALDYGSRLPETHRMLLGAIVAVLTGEADEAEGLYRRVVAEHPDHLEAWYMLGELLQHGNPWRGRSMAESRVPFERMLALSPGDQRAIWHLARVAGTEGDDGMLQSWLHQVDSTSDDARRAQIVDAFVFGSDDEKEHVLADLRGRSSHSVFLSVQEITVLAENLPGAERVARLLMDPRFAAHSRALGLVLSATIQVAQGRWREASANLRAANALDPAHALVAIAFFYTQPLLPVSRADLLGPRARILAGLPRSGFGDSLFRTRYDYLKPYLLGLLDARLGERSSLATHAGDLERSADSAAQRLGRELRALVLHADSGPAIGLRRLRPRDLQEWRTPLPFRFALAPSGYERFLRAEWLRELGRDDEALGWYGGLDQEDLTGLIYVAPSHLRQAEIYQRHGDSKRARAHYQSFLHWWRDADPELQPLLDSARSRLVNLSSVVPK